MTDRPEGWGPAGLGIRSASPGRCEWAASSTRPGGPCAPQNLGSGPRWAQPPANLHRRVLRASSTSGQTARLGARGNKKVSRRPPPPGAPRAGREERGEGGHGRPSGGPARICPRRGDRLLEGRRPPGCLGDRRGLSPAGGLRRRNKAEGAEQQERQALGTKAGPQLG